MVTKVMEAAPPMRKYESMSGSWKAALKASAAAVRPRSQAMYLVLTSPMTREAMTEDMSRSVAVKAVWLWEGRRMARARRQRGGVEVEDIEIDSTGRMRGCGRCGRNAGPSASSLPPGSDF